MVKYLLTAAAVYLVAIVLALLLVRTHLQHQPGLSCGSIMQTPQAEAFGFANPLLGIAGFAVVTTVGVVLVAGATLPRWFWLGLQAGALFGVVFVHWLMYQSLYVIDALCPYCMIVWAVTIPCSGTPPCTTSTLDTCRCQDATGLLTRYHGVVVTVWYLAIAIAALHAFWTYWMTLI